MYKYGCGGSILLIKMSGRMDHSVASSNARSSCFDFVGINVVNQGEFLNQEVFGSIQHLPLAEGEILFRFEEGEVP